jgi:flagellar motility protein MotE (MotC chaperone)
MSIFSAAGAALGGLLGGMPGAAVGASIGGGIDRNAAAQESAQQAQAFSASQYASRYQTQVKDMEAAGLNPMLAYTQSPGASPQGVTYQPTNIAERAASDYSSAYNVQREGERIEADTRLKGAQQEAQESMSKLNDAQRDVANQMASKIEQEIKNLKTDQDRVVALIDNIKQEYQNLVKQNWNLTDTGNMLRATVDKLKAEVPYLGQKSFAAEMQGKLTEVETKLRKLDLNAAEKFDNFGREYQQYAPIIDLLKHIFGPRSGGITINKVK